MKLVDLERMKKDPLFKQLDRNTRKKVEQNISDFNRQQIETVGKSVERPEIKSLIEPIRTGPLPLVSTPEKRVELDPNYRSNQMMAREKKLALQEQAFPEARFWNNAQRLMNDRDLTDEEFEGIAKIKAENPKLYDFSKFFVAGYSTAKATASKSWEALANTASWGILTDDSKALKMSEERGQAIEEMKAGALGEVIGGITGSLTSLMGLGVATRPFSAGRLFTNWEKNRKLAKILMDTTDATAMFATDSLIRSAVQNERGELTREDFLKNMGMSVGFGATMGVANAVNPANQVLRSVAQAGMGGGIGFLETLVMTGDIKEAGMNAIINGALQVMTMPSMREYNRAIVKNQTIADISERLFEQKAVRSLDEGNQMAEIYLNRLMKMGKEGMKPETQKRVLDEVVAGKPEQMKLEYKGKQDFIMPSEDMVARRGEIDSRLKDIDKELKQDPSNTELLKEQTILKNEVREMGRQAVPEEVRLDAEQTKLRTEERLAKEQAESVKATEEFIQKDGERIAEESVKAIKGEPSQVGIKDRTSLKEAYVKAGVDEKVADAVATLNDAVIEGMAKRTGRSKEEGYRMFAGVEKATDGKGDLFQEQTKADKLREKANAIENHLREKYGKDKDGGYNTHLWKKEETDYLRSLYEQAYEIESNIQKKKDDEYLNNKDRIILEKKFRDEVEKIIDEGKYDNYGLRVNTKNPITKKPIKVKIGDTAKKSYYQPDGEITTIRHGTSAIRIAKKQEYEKIMKMLKSYRSLEDEVLLLGSDNAKPGNDPFEIEMDKAIILAIYKDPAILKSKDTLLQTKQTDMLSKEDANFIKNSKIKEVLYHGSPNSELTQITEFNPNTYGYYFTPDINTASYYTGDKGKVYKVIINAKKIANLDDENTFIKIAKESITDLEESRNKVKIESFIKRVLEQAVNKNEKRILEGLDDIGITKNSDIERKLNDWRTRDSFIDNFEDLINDLKEDYPKLYNSFEINVPIESKAIKEALKAYGTDSFYIDYQKEFMQTAESMGYDAVKFTDPSSSGEPTSYAVFNPNKIKILKEDNTLAQEAKGSISFDQLGRGLIKFFKDSDASTPIHESVHLWRRTMERFNDPMYGELKTLYGVKDKWTRSQDEQFARDFEGYLREGKAPKKELVPIFEQFKQWLLDIYKTVKELRLKLNPEKRAFFDRLLGKVETKEATKPVEKVAEKVAKTPQRPPQIAEEKMTKEPTFNEPMSPSEITIDNRIKAKVNDKDVEKAQDYFADLKSIVNEIGLNELGDTGKRIMERIVDFEVARGSAQTIGRASDVQFQLSKAGRLLNIASQFVRQEQVAFIRDMNKGIQEIIDTLFQSKTSQKIDPKTRELMNKFRAELRKDFNTLIKSKKKPTKEDYNRVLRNADRRAMYDFQKEKIKKLQTKLDKGGDILKKDYKDEDPITKIYRKVDNIRRGLLVTQPITTARNIISNIGTIGFRALDDIWVGTLNAMRGKKDPFAEAREGIKGLRALPTIILADMKIARSIKDYTKNVFKGDRQSLEDMIEKTTTSKQDKKWIDEFTKVMGDNVSKDVKRILGSTDVTLESAGALEGGARKVVDYLNTLNNIQNRVLNRIVFQGEVDAKVKRLGKKSLKDFDELTREKIVNESMKEALSRSFQYTPTSGAGKAIIDFWHKAPVMTLINPFIRFQVNAVKFLLDYNPLAVTKLIKLADKGFKEKIEADDIERINYERDIAKSITGTMLLVIALAIRKQQMEKGGLWSDIIVEDEEGNKKSIDIRAFAPITQYMYLADMILKKPEDRKWGDALNELISLNRMAGTATTISDMIRSRDVETSLDGMAKILGEYLSGFTVPVRFLKSLAETVSEEEFKGRQTRIEPKRSIIETPTRANIPFLSQTLPERKSVYTGESQKKPYAIYPLVRQLTGVNMREISDLELKLKKIDYPMYRKYPRTGNRDIDNIAVGEMGKVMAKMSKNLIRAIERIENSDRIDKKEIIGKLLDEKISEARTIGVNMAKRKYAKENPEDYKKYLEKRK